jgi:CRP/FNR family transcriptional regulator
MILNLKTFPSFSNALIEDINSNALDQFFVAGDVIMRTGQYIKIQY